MWIKNKEYIEEIKRQYIDGELIQTEFNDLVREVFEKEELVWLLEEWRENHDESCIIEARLNYYISNYL